MPVRVKYAHSFVRMSTAWPTCRPPFQFLLQWVLVTIFFASCGAACADETAKPDALVQFTVAFTPENAEAVVSGRIILEAQDGGVLLEERNGRIRQLTPAVIRSRMFTETPFAPLEPDELGRDLLSQLPAGFEIFQTEHYVICSNSSEVYAKFCGKLLERVFDEYFKFMKNQEMDVAEPAGKLPIIILESEAEFKEFASKQHPETSFENIPGYYSTRENQTLLLDLSHDRSIRSVAAIRKRLAEQPIRVATMVHEAVHQLAFNTGLQVRMADNPVWFSEGLALYFEPIEPRSATLWSRPGTVNARFHPEFVRCSENGTPEIKISELLQTDKSFLSASTVALAYAEGWALTTYLFREEKAGMKKFLANLSQRKPLKPLTPEQRIQEFEVAFGKSPDEIERDLVPFIRRLRVPK